MAFVTISICGWSTDVSPSNVSMYIWSNALYDDFDRVIEKYNDFVLFYL